MLPFEPYIMRCSGKGMMIVIRRYRIWSAVITRDSKQAYLKRIRNAELEYCGSEFDYPGGVGAAAERFLNPVLGIIQISPTIKRELENIVKQYTTKANARRTLAKIGDYALSKSDEFIIKNAEGNYELDDVAAEAYQYERVASKQTQPKASAVAGNKKHTEYVIISGADFSKRKGGFRLTLDAIASGLKTADRIHAYVCSHKEGYKLADIYSDISVGKRNGYIQGDK